MGRTTQEYPKFLTKDFGKIIISKYLQHGLCPIIKLYLHKKSQLKYCIPAGIYYYVMYIIKQKQFLHLL